MVIKNKICFTSIGWMHWSKSREHEESISWWIISNLTLDYLRKSSCWFYVVPNPLWDYLWRSSCWLCVAQILRRSSCWFYVVNLLIKLTSIINHSTFFKNHILLLNKLITLLLIIRLLNQHFVNVFKDILNDA